MTNFEDILKMGLEQIKTIKENIGKAIGDHEVSDEFKASKLVLFREFSDEDEESKCRDNEYDAIYGELERVFGDKFERYENLTSSYNYARGEIELYTVLYIVKEINIKDGLKTLFEKMFPDNDVCVKDVFEFDDENVSDYLIKIIKKN